MKNATQTKKSCTAATVQDIIHEVPKLQDYFTALEEKKQESKYTFTDFDEDFSMIEFGIDAISCIQIALAEGSGISDVYESGLYYLTTRLKEDVTRLHDATLAAIE